MHLPHQVSHQSSAYQGRVQCDQFRRCDQTACLSWMEVQRHHQAWHVQVKPILSP
nr:MAG TPA: hypothetical protein [Caudoviricetes sp.]